MALLRGKWLENVDRTHPRTNLILASDKLVLQKITNGQRKLPVKTYLISFYLQRFTLNGFQNWGYFRTKLSQKQTANESKIKIEKYRKHGGADT